MSSSPQQDDLFSQLLEAACEAGHAIMDVYGSDIEVLTKDDRSPVTAADHAAEAIILARLARAAPEIPVISEEAASAGGRLTPAPRFFLVDPLDGTREFIKRNDEFTVNIALIEEGVPVMGVVYAPALSTLYAASPGRGAIRGRCPQAGGASDIARAPIAVRTPPAEGMTAVVSRSHANPAVEDILAAYPVARRRSAGSSLKFCLLAAGEADLYPRCGRTMEWDTAAGQAVLEHAGGSVVTLDGEPLRYGKAERGLDNPHFIARGWT